MVLKKLRLKVIRYKFVRLKNIFFLPTLYELRFFFKNKFSFIFNSIDTTENIAIYDLRANPITFDFVHFLGGASFFFKDKGGKFRLFIVNDNAETTGKSSWENYGDIINTEKQNTRIYSLLMPIAFCFSQCNQSINLIKPKELPYFLNKKHNIYPLRNKRNFYNF